MLLSKSLLPGLERLFDHDVTLIELNLANVEVPTELDREALSLKPGEGLRARYEPALARAVRGGAMFDPEAPSSDTILLNRAVPQAHSGQTIELQKYDAQGTLVLRKRFTIEDAIITDAGLTLIAATPERLP